MKTLLVYPPWRQPFMPPLGLAGLAGYFEAHGEDCLQRDLNLESFDRLLGPAWFQRTASELERRIAAIEQENRLDGQTALFHQTLISASLRLPALTRLVAEAKQILNDDQAFYRLPDYRQAMRALEEALSVVFLAWSPCHPSLHGHRAAAGDRRPGTPAEAQSHGEQRLVKALLQELFIGALADHPPRLLAVVADYRSQLLPALTLLRTARRALPGLRTALAGWMAEEMLLKPPPEENLQELVDVLVSGPPEEPLLTLTRALAADGSLDEVPGLSPRGPQSPPMLRAAETTPAEQLPLPSFRGLPLNLYFSPEPVLPVRASSAAADQLRVLGERYQARRFLLTGALESETAGTVADTLSGWGTPLSWFASLGRGEPLDQELFHRLAAGGCAKLQLRVGPGAAEVCSGHLDQIHRALRLGPAAGIGIHLHCRLDQESDGREVTEPLRKLLARSGQWLTGPGFSFSCRVVRDGRLSPATGGSAPDLYNDASAPVPGAVPGFGRDPGDEQLPPEARGEKQRWRLVREAGEAMGPNLTPGTAVHDFLYLARFKGAPPVAETEISPPAVALQPGLVLVRAPRMTRGRFRVYIPVGAPENRNASGTIRFEGTGHGWRASIGDGYHCRSLPDLALAFLDQCDGVQSWELALSMAAGEGSPVMEMAEPLVRMLLAECLLRQKG